MDIIPTDKRVQNAVSKVVLTLIQSGAHRATKYLSEKYVVNVTRPIFGPKGKKRLLKGSSIHLVIKLGKPNYAERAFIAQCVKAKEPFPVKKIQLKYPPKKK